MKQGQQVRGGRRRHEVEKTCRRRPVELGKLGHLIVPLPRTGRRCRGRDLTGGADGSGATSVAKGTPAARRAAHSEGGRKLMRGDSVELSGMIGYPAVRKP